jgi:hypothetical protein
LFRVADSVVAVSFEAGAEPRFSAARTVLVGRFSEDRDGSGWDISSDGRRFVFTRTQGESSRAALNVVLHWFDQLRAQQR